ncbi:uncharacterized protein LOC113759461 [Coffea eugenioides]|uniref:uncharacterized protein LOC113759461 n=1 Tax=Coffea eugenioides TaxID=49369 RepID=UPI000F604A1B|nr:uncharacterized protein LOC113759461 [Coffea eugenioides]
MATLRNLVLELHSQRGQSARNSPSDNEVSQGRNYQAPTRFSRLEFPRFHGEDFQEWLFKIEKFFEVDETPNHVKMKMVAMNLEGKAVQRHQVFLRSRITRNLPAWEEYIKEMASRFGVCLYNDPMGELKALKQEGSVLEYQEQFEELLNRVDLPEDYATSCFLSGLKAEIQLAVRMFMPKILRDDKALLPSPSQDRSEKAAEGHTRKPFKRLSSTEMDEKRAKGLCFWCDEKFGVGCRCRNRQLFQLEVCAEDEDEELEVESEEEGDVSQANLAHIPLNAMTLTAVPKFRTMRVTGHVGKTSVNIFIDCGSSHNFIHPDLINKLGLRVQEVPPLVVEVADGNKITTNRLCTGFTWKMQNQVFKTDAMVLPVESCELVLGVQWLSTLGDIKRNIKEMKMKFLNGKRRVVLRGKGQQAIQLAIAEEQLGSLCQAKKNLQVTNFTHDSEASELNELLMEFEDVFKESSELPPHRTQDHQIVLNEGTVPVNVRPYRYLVFQKNEIEKLIQEILQSGVIRHSTSPFSSPVVLVKKKDGTWRMCIDYRELNLATIRICPDDIAKTAFRTHERNYEFVVMPFGLTNAYSTFQSLMNTVFRPYLRKFILVFFDDILKSKCSFAQKQVAYLGHVISGEEVQADPQKVQAIQQWPVSSNLKELRGFFGLVGYYRRFIKDFGKLARPLTELLKKNNFIWTKQATEAFSKLKLVMSSPPVLALPDFSQTFEVETDASGDGIGAILSQKRRPLAYFSQALATKHKGISVYEREMLAIRVSTPMQQKWVAKLMGHDYEFQYKKGVDNVVADALSRQPSSNIAILAPILVIKSALITEIQNNCTQDPQLQLLI